MRRASFENRLIAKLREQVKGRRTGFLLGAGASFLDGKGYPLALGLWPAIKGKMSIPDRRQVDAQLARGAENLEQALDALDQGRSDPAIRHRVTCAIAVTFRDARPPLDSHRAFVTRLARRSERRVPVFTLNYDPLMELASDAEEKYLVDGFAGTVNGYFCPASYCEYRGTLETRRNRQVLAPLRGVINLYKLHGSLGWFSNDQGKPGDASHISKRNSTLRECPATRYGLQNSMLISEFRGNEDAVSPAARSIVELAVSLRSQYR